MEKTCKIKVKLAVDQDDAFDYTTGASEKYQMNDYL